MNSLYGEEIFHFNNDLRRNVLHNQILFPARIGNLYLRFVKIVIVNYLDQLNMTASQRIVETSTGIDLGRLGKETTVHACDEPAGPVGHYFISLAPRAVRFANASPI